MLSLAAGLFCALGAYSAKAQQEAAQNYPVKPIRLIVPWVAGEGTDIVARIIALKLSENLGQQIEVESWRGLFVPARTPREVINKLHDQVDKIVQLQEIRERIMAAGFDTVTSTPEQLGAFSVAELAKWAKVAKEAGIRVK
jgi:tripartite-type tricarboxylate transporter receptor subunit TctC